MAFASVYPHYIAKAEKKGRTKAEVHAIIQWLTGYDEKALQKQIETKVDFQTFFARAPQINPNVSKITGVICGYRVEQIEDKLMRALRRCSTTSPQFPTMRTQKKFPALAFPPSMRR